MGTQVLDFHSLCTVSTSAIQVQSGCQVAKTAGIFNSDASSSSASSRAAEEEPYRKEAEELESSSYLFLGRI